MNSVRLYYVWLDETLPNNDSMLDKQLFLQWMSALAEEKWQSIERLLVQRDRDVSLIAQRLLNVCADDEGIENFNLKDICFPPSEKPYWKNSDNQFLDFNISHSGNLIVVSLSSTVKLGVDAEKHRELKNLNFKMVLSKIELEEIKKQPERFFELWSQKEAVVKAANTTGIARMRDVKLKAGCAELDGKIWFIKNISEVKSERENYSIHLATSEPIDVINFRQLSVDDL